jgi:hypothetical protein
MVDKDKDILFIAEDLRYLEPINIKVLSLVCSLYTLFENHKIFGKLNLKNDIFLDICYENRFFVQSKNFHELYDLLNDASLRRFSYHLLKPLINKNYFLFTYNIQNIVVNKENYTEKIFLKKYLRKFNYNYRKYFLVENINIENTPTDREINTNAIEILFLLAGI